MPEDPRVGTTIAGYTLERRLGRGGMAVVYLAHDHRLDRRVALKLLDPELSTSADFRERFVRESRAAASLDHPNVVPIYEAGEADGMLFIAMRFVEGSDLSRMIASLGSLPLMPALQGAMQLCGALEAAHRRGLVHRDVKPANILIDYPRPPELPHMYLADFGLAKLSGPGESGLTEAGQFVGTLDYVAPEQIEGEEVDGRADIYAVGCVLVHCLTGKPPFPRASGAAVMYAHLTQPPPKVTLDHPELPPELDGIIARALAKSPADRYQRPGEMAFDLMPLVPRTSEVGTGPPPQVMAFFAAESGQHQGPSTEGPDASAPASDPHSPLSPTGSPPAADPENS